MTEKHRKQGDRKRREGTRQQEYHRKKNIKD
jgi:hypothetical protein